jgi:tetratricopeptide (TPR) repeat protein
MQTAADLVEKNYEQGRALYMLRRYSDAEKMLRRALTKEPRHALSHAYLALCLLAQSPAANPQPAKLRDALDEARRAVSAKPDHEFPFFVLAWVCLANRKEADALRAAQDGMRINPQSAWGYLIYAQVYQRRSEWEKALRSADYGLSLDPEMADLLNLRAYALIMLGHPAEAREAVELALARDPDSDVAHTNRGWLTLYDGDHRAALVHFREGLRLDPQSEAARQGFIYALQARNPLYNGMVRYSLWMSRLTRAESLAFLLGLASADQVLRMLANSCLLFYLVYLPFTFFYSIFIFFSWISDALFYLLLRFNRTGRLLLSKDEVSASNAFGACMLVLCVNIAGGLIYWKPGFLVGAILAVMMMVPISGIFKLAPDKRNRRAILAVLVTWLAISAACGQAGVFLATPWLLLPLAIFVAGWFFYPWVVNLMILIE